MLILVSLIHRFMTLLLASIFLISCSSICREYLVRATAREIVTSQISDLQRIVMSSFCVADFDQQYIGVTVKTR